MFQTSISTCSRPFGRNQSSEHIQNFATMFRDSTLQVELKHELVIVAHLPVTSKKTSAQFFRLPAGGRNTCWGTHGDLVVAELYQLLGLQWRAPDAETRLDQWGTFEAESLWNLYVICQ